MSALGKRGRFPSRSKFDVRFLWAVDGQLVRKRIMEELPTIREPSRVVSHIEMPSATTSPGSASTRHKPGVFRLR